ncbi:DNA-binding response regulator [Opitutaceae bacterium EW11]|nr:DNA-binding response regulator [Opitutaceae bacterium EW11]
MPLKNARFLLLEDEPIFRRRISAYLEKAGAEVTPAKSLAEARELLRTLAFDFALLDVNLPDGRGLSLLSDKSVPDSVVTLVMTAEGAVEGAVEAMRLGAADYLVKPFDLDELSVRLARARRDRQKRRGEQFRREQQAAAGQLFFFGEAMRAIEVQVEKILAADRRIQGAPPPPILLEGETGTGKTTLARWIHQHGPRSDGPLIDVNCSALPDTLAESELFGHERGAFTDAKEARIGLLEAAEGGTVFLDELPSLSPAIQAKLLKAVEDRNIRRLGSSRTVSIDARLIAATNADLQALIATGRFREDLYHRLDLFRIRIPPLRERGQDIVPLAEMIAARVAKNYGLRSQSIPAVGQLRLRAHRWPGNVRELAHEIERSLVFDDDKLTFSSLAASTGASTASGESWMSPQFRFPENGFDLEKAIDGFIQRALAQAEGNVSAAARLLGVSRDYVRYRLKDRDRPEEPHAP